MGSYRRAVGAATLTETSQDEFLLHPSCAECSYCRLHSGPDTES